MIRRRRRQRFTVDDTCHFVHTCADATVVIAVLEPGGDDFIDDTLAGDVSERTFESIADLDPHSPIVPGNEQERAVVDALAPQLPSLGDPNRVLLDRLGLGGRHDQNGNLAALARLEGSEPLFQCLFLICTQCTGLISHPRHKRWDFYISPGCGKQYGGDQQPHRHSGGAHCLAGAGAEKSTFGGVEMAFSFSTLKFALTVSPNIFAVRFDGNERTVTL